MYYGNKFRKDVYYENYTRCVRTIEPSATTITTSPSQPCAAKEIYGEDSNEVHILRSFRDNILSKTPEGQEIIRLYYEWSSVIAEAMREDKRFKKEIKELTDGALSIIVIR